MTETIMPRGMDAEVPCRPAFDVDTPFSIQAMIKAGIPRMSIIAAIMNNDQMDKQDALGRYETELKKVNEERSDE